MARYIKVRVIEPNGIDSTAWVLESEIASTALIDALVYKGAIDCSSNPNYPAADAGDLYMVSVAGKIGGASGVVVEVGDMFICKTDGTLAGTQAQRGAAWNIAQTNLLGPIPVKASGAEVTTGTDDAKFVTAKALADAGIGAGVALETPTGDVDGVNDEFVFVSTPVAIFRNGVLQAADVYTIVGTTVTFDTPPASGVISGLTQ